jgi:lysozyme family protein
MADFEVAYKLTAVNEGGYSNDPADMGGETWRGISRKMHPDWQGWPIIDALKTKGSFPQSLAKSNDLEILVKIFYRAQFWNVMRGDEIDFQEIANQIYDDGVNTGIISAIRKAQKVAFGLPDDPEASAYIVRQLGITYGKMDDKTLKRLNA